MLAVRPNNPELAKFAEEVDRSPAYLERQKILRQALFQRWTGFDFQNQAFIIIDDSALQEWIQQYEYSQKEIQLAVYGFEYWKQSLQLSDRQSLLNQIVIAFYAAYEESEVPERIEAWGEGRGFSKDEYKAAKKAVKAHQAATRTSADTPKKQPEVTADPLTQMGLAIATVFNEFGAKCRFVPPVLESPRCLEFVFEKGPGVSNAKFQTLAPELLSSPRLKALEMQTVPVTAIYPGVGISVQVLKNTFEPIMLENYLQWRDSSATDPIVFDLGIDLRGDLMQLDLNSFPHFMTSATSGGGKTNLQHVMVVSGAYRYSPAHLQFVLIDPKQTGFKPYEGLPHLWTGLHLHAEGLLPHDVAPLVKAPLLQAEETVRFFMKLLKAEVDRRNRLFSMLEGQLRVRIADLRQYNRRAQKPLPHLIVMTDETRPLIEWFEVCGYDFDVFITQGAELFRSSGIHFGCNMQYSKGVVLPGARECLAHKLVGFMSSEEGARSILGDKTAMSLGKQGEFIYMFGGQKTRFQSFYAGDEDSESYFVYRAVDRIKNHYRSFL